MVCKCKLNSDMIGNVADMHTKFGVREVVNSMDPATLDKFIEFRMKFLSEELNEAYSALGFTITPDNAPQHRHGPMSADNAEHVVDAMIDLCVVAIGTLDALGVDINKAWDAVHQANMQKKPGVKPGRPNPLGLPDLIKPEGWVSPTHADNIGLLSRLKPPQ